MEDFNSPVIKEIPVYVSQELARRLMVYQYPLEAHPEEGGLSVVRCSVKEDHEVLIELERDLDTPNVSRSKAEQMAINVDGPGNCDDPIFPRKLMDKQILVSKVQKSNVAVGLLQEGRLHVTPAAGLALLRPSFSYLDRGDKRAKLEAKQPGEEGSEEEEELTQVTVKFARAETERAKRSREKSYSYLAKQTARQTWYRADYYPSDSTPAHVERDKLVCRHMGEEVSESRALGPALIETLLRDSDDERGRTAHGLPLTRLNILPALVDRIRTIMLEAHVMQLGTLQGLLGTAVEAEEVVKVVQQASVLVQGCWVVHSDILLPKDSAPYGVPYSLLRCARDYMLYLLTRSRTVTRRKLMEVIKIPGDVIKALLEQVAKLNSNKEWELKLPTDHHFIAKYPEVVGRQQAKWELRAEQFLAGLRAPEPGAAPPSRHRRRSGRESYSSDTDTESKRSMPSSKPRRPRLE